MNLVTIVHLVRSFPRRLFGPSGDFRRGEKTERSRALAALWFARWPDIAPSPRGLQSPRAALSGDRWVRFHSLPGSKQYAETDEERRTVLARHFAVLRYLSRDRPELGYVVIGEDWGPGDIASGWTRKYLEGAWPWLKSPNPPERGEAVFYHWVLQHPTLEAMEPVLQRVAAEEATIVISNAALDWLYHPYDGGADVYTATTAGRDALRGRYAEWLPAREDGL